MCALARAKCALLIFFFSLFHRKELMWNGNLLDRDCGYHILKREVGVID